MRIRLFLTTFLFSCLAALGAPSATKTFADLEHHLQSLKSLELEYEAEGTQGEGGAVSGRLVWVRPDKFVHDTPEWTLCEQGGEQWRYLKAQNTLIREKVTRRERWTPESVLFDLGSTYRPQNLEELGDGTRRLIMTSRDANIPETVTLEFPPEDVVPDWIHFELVDGTVTDYRITEWNENEEVDPTLFTPPQVPAENVIDFRDTESGNP